MYENLHIYRGSTFDCSISLVDRKRNTYLLAEGDKLFFGVKANIKVDPKTDQESEDIIRKELTAEDEIAGKYHFRLTPAETNLPDEHYYYYVAIELADDSYYQIAPYSYFDVMFPIILNHEQGREICCQVPKIMRRKTCKDIKEQLLDFIKSVYNNRNTLPIRIRNFDKLDIVIVNNQLNPDRISSEKLLKIIEKKTECFDSENYIIIGFNHTIGSSQNSWQSDYNAAIHRVFNDHFFDLETCMKELIYSENNELISCKALQIANIEPSENDLQRIALMKYPECILSDDTHFNDIGYDIIAQILTKEVNQYAM